MMDRRQQLENIIIGTLLESTWRHNYFDDVKCLVSVDMFRDETNKRIYGLIWEMNSRGMVETTPSDIFAEYGASVVDIAADMCDLCTDYSFIHLNTKYREEQFLKGCKGRKEVTFGDYVNQFIIMSYDKAS